jgi:hypothetical protein
VTRSGLVLISDAVERSWTPEGSSAARFTELHKDHSVDARAALSFHFPCAAQDLSMLCGEYANHESDIEIVRSRVRCEYGVLNSSRVCPLT